VQPVLWQSTRIFHCDKEISKIRKREAPNTDTKPSKKKIQNERKSSGKHFLVKLCTQQKNFLVSTRTKKERKKAA
jgi:hypothetical protein